MSKCKHCGQNISDKLLKEKKDKSFQKRQKTLDKLRKANIRFGRPRTTNYFKVRELREAGFSLNQIASKLNVSKGSVQYALKGQGHE